MDSNQFLISVSIVLFVVAFVALAIWAFKAFVLGGGGSGRSGSAFLRQRDRRLGLVESTAIDGRRRLLLVRRDDVEHLVMIGGPVDMLIETGIQGAAASGAAARGRDHCPQRYPPSSQELRPSPGRTREIPLPSMLAA